MTSGIDTGPHGDLDIPEDTYLPFFLALGLTVLLVGLLADAALVGIAGVVLAVTCAVWWAWQTEEDQK